MLKQRYSTRTYLRSALAGLDGKNTLREREREPACKENNTCNFRVRTEVKGTIVVLGWVDTVGSEIFLDVLSEIEEADHTLLDCTILSLDGVCEGVVRIQIC